MQNGEMMPAHVSTGLVMAANLINPCPPCASSLQKIARRKCEAANSFRNSSAVNQCTKPCPAPPPGSVPFGPNTYVVAASLVSAVVAGTSRPAMSARAWKQATRCPGARSSSTGTWLRESSSA